MTGLRVAGLWALVALSSLSNYGVHAFYLPGVNPQSFAEGDP
jgi:hypothetical protein